MFIKNSIFLICLFLVFYIININNNLLRKDEWAILDIPNIQFEEKIYRDSNHDTFDNRLYIQSTLEEENFEKKVLASYFKSNSFKNLNQLKINDEIKVITSKEIFLFRVVHISLEEKIEENLNKANTLSLVTYKENNKENHMLVLALYSGKIVKN